MILDIDSELTDQYGIHNYWAWCCTCDCTTVMCWKCGNNTCNGGHGYIDGEDCSECERAYREEAAAIEAGNVPTKQDIENAEKRMEKIHVCVD